MQQIREEKNFPLIYLQAISLTSMKDRESEGLAILYRLLRQLET